MVSKTFDPVTQWEPGPTVTFDSMAPMLVPGTWSMRSDINDTHPSEDHHIVTGQNKLILCYTILRSVRFGVFVEVSDIYPGQSLAKRTLGLRKSRPAPLDRVRYIEEVSDQRKGGYEVHWTGINTDTDPYSL